MISLDVGECRVDILPVVNGLVSEAEKVRSAYGGYDAYGASLGIEALEAIRCRDSIGVDNVEVSEIDLAYSERMSYWGEIQVPSPAFCEIVDLCTADGLGVIPLDMKDEDFDEAFPKFVSAVEFATVHRLAKRGMKVPLSTASPEETAKDWDRFISRKKGFAALDRFRERHIANEIIDTVKYRGTLLAVIEVERAEGVAELVKEHVKRMS